MTREQAINYLRSSGFTVEQIKMITDALSTQPDNDHIWGALSKVYNMDYVPDEAKSIIGDVMLELGEPHREEGVRK